MSYLKKTIFLLTIITLIQCASESNASYPFSEAEQTYEAVKNNDNAVKLLGAYNTYISENRSDASKTLPVMEKALAVAQSHQPNAAAIYINGLLREDPKNPKNGDRIALLSEIMSETGKSDASEVLKSSLVRNFPSHDKSTSLKQTLKDASPENIIAGLAEARLENPDQFGINRAASFKYVDACEAYALANPDNPKTPEYLFDAAEMAKLLKTTNKALSIYDWLIEKYPNYSKTPSALFIKAFTLENELGNDELAKQAYQQFLDKYPDNDFADDARFSLENIGKSPDEVLKAIEARSKQAQ